MTFIVFLTVRDMSDMEQLLRYLHKYFWIFMWLFVFYFFNCFNISEDEYRICVIERWQLMDRIAYYSIQCPHPFKHHIGSLCVARELSEYPLSSLFRISPALYLLTFRCFYIKLKTPVGPVSIMLVHTMFYASLIALNV